MRRKGFTILELAVVLVILGILLALGLTALSYYRRETALNAATDRLVAEIQNAQAEARTNGLVQQRTGVPLGVLGASVPQPPGDGQILGQIVEKTAGNTLTVNREWFIGDVGGSGINLQVSFSNLPLAALTSDAGDQGTDLEIAYKTSTTTALASLIFDPDGRVHTVSSAISGYIYLGTESGQYVLEIAPTGKVNKTRVR